MIFSKLNQNMELKKLYSYPLSGIHIIEPSKPPKDDEVLLGYELLDDYDNEYFVRPHPKRLNTLGWVSVVLCFLFFWPATCIPCFLPCSYSKCQRPVYGNYLEPTYLVVKNIEIPEEKDDIKTKTE